MSFQSAAICTQVSLLCPQW